MSRLGRFVAVLALAGLSLPLRAGAQAREVISKEIAVGRSEASLRLQFSTGDPLEISLRDGGVYVNGESAGSYTSGDALDGAWRSLLGDAVSLDDGALARRLEEWSPPSDLAGDDLQMASRIDEAIHGALTVQAEPEKPSLDVSTGGKEDADLVRALLGHADRLATLEEALKDVGAKGMKLHVGENVNVPSGETVDGTLVVVQGNVRIAGDVTGDVVVVDGKLSLENGSHVGGDVRLADAEMNREGGTIEGEVVNVERTQRNLEQEIRDRMRTEIRNEVRNEIRSEMRVKDRRSGASGLFAPLRNVFRGVGGLIENLVAIVVLGLIGMGVVAFAPDNLDVVAETARRSPGRAAMVGTAGAFLLIPVWVLGAITLAVSIVGIPVMIAWLPLFPLAAVAAALLGYLAVARNLGEWLSDSGYRYTDWIRKSNPVYTVVGGVAGLMLFFVVGNILRMVPFFGFFRGVLVFGGTLATLATVMIGFGAVLLTRAGRRREYEPMSYDEAWARTVEPEESAHGEAPSGAGSTSSDVPPTEGDSNA